MTRLWMSIFIVSGLALGTARAEKKVDWSQYLEQPGDRVPAKTTPKVVEEAPTAAKAKKAKAPRAASAKARPKAVAKRKPARRR
jgi:hypothetical protein